ncbi:unnamed protein product [Peniophora sp. CBMAI 1063]|nr:unnamed protein product [Peniophora sp. CBMAI 1063]
MSADTRVQTLLDERTTFYRTITQEKYLEAAAQRLSAFDTELDGIDNSLALLRRQRNLLVPALRLPVELVSHIFLLLTELWPHYYPDPADHDAYASGALPPRLGWIRAAMHVCHDWRQVALLDARLWTAATTGLGKDWLDRMLQLNSGRPTVLDVWSDWEGGHRTWIPDTTSGILDDLAELQILGPVVDLKLLRELSSAPPALRVLRVHSYPKDDTYPTLPWPLFIDDTTGNLEELYINNTSFWKTALNQPILQNLRRLALTTSQPVPDPDTWADLSALTGALNRLPALEVLIIKRHYFWVEEGDTVVNKLTPIILPRLATVDLFSTWDTIFLLLRRLRPSPDVRYNLASDFPNDSHPEPNVAGHIRSLLDVHLKAHPESSPLSKMQTIEWKAHTPSRWQSRIAGTTATAGPADPVFQRTLTLSAWRANSPDYLMSDYAGYQPAPTPDFRFSFRCENNWDPPYEPENAIKLGVFPSARCVSFQPAAQLMFDIYNQWEDFFQSSPLLTWLRADRMAVASLLASGHDRWMNIPGTVKTLALLCARWGQEEGIDGPLARLWTEARSQERSLERVIVGRTPFDGHGFHSCVYETGVNLTPVSRPESMEADDDEYMDW